ncbi:AaceriAFR249Wp [[Ashbya] aceris (nom. inval.)]|nr:AaceriAFR249Wp [[Ashbya] aceris (nom. inval.)]
MSSEAPAWARCLVEPGYLKSISVVSSNTLPQPPGFSKKQKSKTRAASREEGEANRERIDALQVKKAWQLAFQPSKAIPMNFIMSYMSGTSLQIIPIMTALMLLTGPVKSVLHVRSTFKGLLDNEATYGQVMAAMCLYVFFQTVLMAIGLQKLNAMGLLPNKHSDWLAWETPMAYSMQSYAF